VAPGGSYGDAAQNVYGASKAGLDTLTQGLGDDPHDEGVRILVVRPGFVDTRMISGLDPAPSSTAPQALAFDVVNGFDHRSHTVWAPSVYAGLCSSRE
jgi:decaprenylphospho-beta-D-erythro-pentofuranosid-2-ulose 2-reductase